MYTTLSPSNTIKKRIDRDPNVRSRDELPTVDWDEVPSDIKNYLFNHHAPPSDILDPKRDVYEPIDIHGVLTWVTIDERYIQEYAYWLFCDRLGQGTDYAKKVVGHFEEIADRKAKNELQSEVDRLVDKYDDGTRDRKEIRHEVLKLFGLTNEG